MSRLDPVIVLEGTISMTSPHEHDHNAAYLFRECHEYKLEIMFATCTLSGLDVLA